MKKTILKKKFLILEEEYKQLKNKIDNLDDQKTEGTNSGSNFEEKIDELNQETDDLIKEIDKWEM